MRASAICSSATCTARFPAATARFPSPTLRGTNHQVWFELDPTGAHLASHEPPAYGVVLMDRETLVVHAHDFLDASPRFPFAAPEGMDDRDYALNFAAR